MKKSTRIRNHQSSKPETEMEPLFSTSLPTLPRRKIIQSNIRNSRIFNDNESNNSVATESFSSYRRADSTSHALAEIAKHKFEVMERRRAGMLFIFLVVFALTVYAKSSVNDSRDQNNKDVNESTYYATSDNIISTNKKNEEIDDEETRGEEEPEEEHLHAVKNMRSINYGPDESDIPFFWHIPRCAGFTLKSIMGECLGLVAACEIGGKNGHGTDLELAVIEKGGAMYVNVDTSNLEGIQRAKSMKLVGSTIARPDVIVSSYLLPISQEIYDDEHNGRAFTLLRHPIQRAVSMYHLMIQSGSIPEHITLEQYAQGQGIENNWMVRYLTGRLEGELPTDGLYEAKNILKKKFLIGFVDDLSESVQRFMKYNNWAYDENDTKKAHQQEQCVDMLSEVGSNMNMAGYDLPKKGTKEYGLIVWQTSYDVKLYEYAKELFDGQTKMWGTKERKKADKKKKKLSSG